MLVGHRMIVDDGLIVGSTLSDQIFQEQQVNVVVQIGEGDLDGGRFAHVVDVNVEPK